MAFGFAKRLCTSLKEEAVNRLMNKTNKNNIIQGCLKVYYFIKLCLSLTVTHKVDEDKSEQSDKPQSFLKATVKSKNKRGSQFN